MKKTVYTIALGGLVFLSACNNEPAPETTTAPAPVETPQMTQAQQDSVVNMRVQKEIADKAANDSAINAIAQRKADSLNKVTGAKKPQTVKVVKPAPAKHTTTAPVAPKPETIGQGKPKMGDAPSENKPANSPNTIGQGKPKMGDK